MEVTSKDGKARLPSFRHSSAFSVGLTAFTSLCLGFLTCGTETISVPVPQSCCDNR